jgi:hydrogenase maturation protease
LKWDASVQRKEIGHMRTLVVGFGNVYRRDDGIGGAVVNALRRHLGMTPLALDDDGLDALGHPIDTVVLHQLVPELAQTAADYDLVIFVDAHTSAYPEPIREERLEACYKPALVSHQMHPCTLLQLAGQMGLRQPAGVLLSIKGNDFDFGEGLSAPTAALVPDVVRRVVELASDDAFVTIA